MQPVLQAVDTALVQQAAATHMCLPALLVADVFTGAAWDDSVLLDMDWGPRTWRLYRIWALIRITGCWPLTCFGGMLSPAYLPQCLLCGEHNVRVTHALGECIGTVHLRRQASVPDTAVMILQALDDSGTGDEIRSMIWFVGSCVSAVVAAGLERDTPA